MSFLAPGWLVVAGMAAAVVFGLHLLNRQRLRPRAFPTARFVPEAPVRAVSYAVQPTDVALLLLRIGVVALVGVALARPVSPPPRRTAVIAAADNAEGTDSADVNRALARLTPRPDTVIAMRGLSAALIAARQAGARFAGRADSVDLVVVSPLSAGLWDAATEAIRATWPGRIRLIPAGRRGGGAAGVNLEAAPDHPVRAALTRLGVRANGGPVRLRWLAAPSTDTAAGVYAAGAAMVGRFPRFAADERDGGRAIAWFADGSPAVREYPLNDGCERVVGFAPDAGDGLLRASGLRIVERLIAPCGAGWTPDRYQAADSADVAELAGTGPLAATESLPQDIPPPIALMPLILALVALGAERVLRLGTP